MFSEKSDPSEFGHFIAGESVRGGPRTFQVLAPATGGLLATVDEAGAIEVDAAVHGARDAADQWARTRASSRIARMNRWADAISEHRDELAMLESLESGKPLSMCTVLIAAAAAGIRNASGWIDKLRSAKIPVDPDVLCYTEHEPYGVVGAIIPWNFPAGNFVGKVAPALAAGNAVVVKPAEQTPLVAMRLAQLSAGAGFPPGLITVVNGMGPTTGGLLVAHPEVRKITFTGSSATGLELTRSTGSVLKSFTLELGGKSANIVMPDADLDACVQSAAYTAFLHAGQVCTSGSRLLVHADIAEEFVARLVDRARSLVVGDPMDPATHVGPVITREQLSQIEAKVATALDEGARLMTGGHRLQPAGLEGGNYFEPTIFSDVKPADSLFTTEVFGPVLAVTPFSDLKEAIALANATEYGLAAMIWTSDLATAHVAARSLHAGIVWVNTAQLLDNAVPYGGHLQSGVGVENGLEGLLDYTQSKSVLMNTAPWRSPWQ